MARHQEEEPLLLKTVQVAELLGVEEGFVRGLAKNNPTFPPAVLLGKQRRWRRADILKWVAELPPEQRPPAPAPDETDQPT